MEMQSNDGSNKVETFGVKTDRMAARDIPRLLIRRALFDQLGRNQLPFDRTADKIK